MSNLVATISFGQQLLSGVQSSSNNCPKWPQIVADNKPAGYIVAHRCYGILDEKLRLCRTFTWSWQYKCCFQFRDFLPFEWIDELMKRNIAIPKNLGAKKIQNLPETEVHWFICDQPHWMFCFVFEFEFLSVFIVYLNLYLYLQVGVWGRGGQLHWLNCDQPHWTFLSNNGFLCFHSASP